MIKKLLGDLTDAFKECVDGAQALATYKRYWPDWVLIDIKMKEMDGLAATRLIKAAFPDHYRHGPRRCQVTRSRPQCGSLRLYEQREFV